jgi:hypothetical protein
VLVINPNHKIAHQIGTPAACTHNPPTSVGPVNGDTPLANGDLLVSEVQGSWIDDFTTQGRLVWNVQLPIAYPSDPQQLGRDRYLLADYTTPGQIDEFNRAGKILYRYAVSPRTGRRPAHGSLPWHGGGSRALGSGATAKNGGSGHEYRRSV